MIDVHRINMTVSLELKAKVKNLAELDAIRDELVKSFTLGAGSKTEVLFTIGSDSLSEITYPNRKNPKK